MSRGVLAQTLAVCPLLLLLLIVVVDIVRQCDVVQKVGQSTTGTNQKKTMNIINL